MVEPLLRLRKKFSEELEAIAEINDPEDRFYHENNLLITEEAVNFAYRTGLVKGKILGLGLETQMQEIIDGMNKTCGRVLLDLTEPSSAEHAQHLNRVNSDALQQFGQDYIDRWAMYNKLFKGKK